MVGIKRIFDIEHIFGIKKVEAGRYIIQCCFDFVLFSVSVEHSSKKKISLWSEILKYILLQLLINDQMLVHLQAIKQKIWKWCDNNFRNDEMLRGYYHNNFIISQ